MSKILFPSLLPKEVMEMLEGRKRSFLGICWLALSSDLVQA